MRNRFFFEYEMEEGKMFAIGRTVEYSYKTYVCNYHNRLDRLADELDLFQKARTMCRKV